MNYVLTPPSVFGSSPALEAVSATRHCEPFDSLFEQRGQQLTRRLEEAHLCWGSGACTAAVIMLGSALEGVLYDVARSRHVDGPEPKDHLYGLIGLAEREGWIAKDVTDYAHVQRDHRNLVHPKKQLVDNYALKDDTVRAREGLSIVLVTRLKDKPVRQSARVRRWR